MASQGVPSPQLTATSVTSVVPGLISISQRRVSSSVRPRTQGVPGTNPGVRNPGLPLVLPL